MNGTPRYAMRDHRRAVAASRAQYMKVNANCQTAAARVSENNVRETAETRRARTLTPNPSMSTAVKRVGTAYAEKPYAAVSIMAILVLALSAAGALYSEGHMGKSRISRTII